MSVHHPARRRHLGAGHLGSGVGAPGCVRAFGRGRAHASVAGDSLELGVHRDELYLFGDNRALLLPTSVMQGSSQYRRKDKVIK